MGHRKRRKTIFVACEGESEQGYVAMLQHFADVDGLHVYLDGKVPGGTGNAQTLVSKANEIVRKEQQPNGVNYLSRYIILDSDGLGVAEAKDLRKKASEEEVKLVFQDCCFEAFLLRHFEATKDAAPPNADEAKKQLDKVWKGYRKALSAQKLMKKAQFRHGQICRHETAKSRLQRALARYWPPFVNRHAKFNHLYL